MPIQLQQKISLLETKHKEQLKAAKSKLVAKYRIATKKQQAANNQQFIKNCLKYRKLLDDNILLFGGLQRVINTKTKDDASKLDYFRGLVHIENKKD